MASINQTPKSANDNFELVIISYSKPQVIQSEALLKSLDLLSKLEYQASEESQTFVLTKCGYCLNIYPTVEGRDYCCKVCNETLCLKHRDLLNHHCEKISPSFEKYLMAKNTFKTKLREIKMKGHS